MSHANSDENLIVKLDSFLFSHNHQCSPLPSLDPALDPLLSFSTLSSVCLAIRCEAAENTPLPQCQSFRLCQ